ncbi:mycofactocin-coupled SDR family oxidoreductase [Pseudonocardia petroleophila]|uniref:Mycofactocin-coupled SDR family oxidoreductase n=1 Tax=Pseudonocardia petroleophila TaxID=37331 RepID=A0A7G7MCC1_9PSEU|nr:mycofactocin-coupled SDR family oxidoreductase [Pseudonocardia petroleophila]QNG50432.1 mycofactocin-coupled SDR family oxidoreductase [Pseudonocardia petroleophila]
MGRFDGKVVLITGAGRGQGRSDAVRFAEEGADIVALDVCHDLDTVPYPLATSADLAETVKEVESRDRRILSFEADTRDYGRLEAVVDETVSEFGRIDIVVANAGICTAAPIWELTQETWKEMIDVNLTGVFNPVRAALPTIMAQGPGGAIVLTSSAAGLNAFPNMGHYTAAKHGVTGLMRSLAVELAPHGIRANSVHPTTVDTPMVQNPAFWALLGAQDAEGAQPGFRSLNALRVPYVEAVDISNAVLYLASEEARYVTGVALPVDAGGAMPYRIPHSA